MTENTMITVGMNYNVIEGKNDAFVAMCNKVIETLGNADGHQASYLYQDVNTGNSYLITSEWNDEAAFMAFIQSPEFANVTNWGKEQILAGPPAHKIYKS